MKRLLLFLLLASTLFWLRPYPPDVWLGGCHFIYFGGNGTPFPVGAEALRGYMVLLDDKTPTCTFRVTIPSD